MKYLYEQQRDCCVLYTRDETFVASSPAGGKSAGLRGAGRGAA